VLPWFYFLAQLSGWDSYIEKHPLTSVGLTAFELLSHFSIATKAGRGSEWTCFSFIYNMRSFSVILINWNVLWQCVGLLGLGRSIIKLSWYHWC